MKKIFSLLVTFVLTGCGSNVNYIEGKCVDTDIGCPVTDINYRTKEKVKIDEDVIIETKTIGYFKVSVEREYDIDFTDLTTNDFDFYVKISTENEVYSYKLSNEEKNGIFYGIQKDTRTTGYTIKHDFVINGEYFNNGQKTANLVSFSIVIFSSNEETLLLSRILYSQLIGETIIFSVN